MDELSRLTVLANVSRTFAAQANQTREREALLTIADWYASKAAGISDAPPKAPTRE